MAQFSPPPDTDSRASAIGLASGIGAFLIWGLLAPVYFKAVADVGAVEIVAHRVVWTVVLMAAVVLAMKSPAEVLRAVGSWRRLSIFLVTTALVTANWTIFIYAIIDGKLVQASLGYYINPLVNVILGVLFLGERLSRRQLAAVLIAGAGVGSLVVHYGAVPWIALSLALTFGFYALVRKKAAIDPLIGLLAETALLVPLAAGYLLWLGADGAFATGAGVGHDLLLMLSGPITAVPLILFMIGAARLKLATVGLLQYIAPTGQLLLGVLVYGERFTNAHAIAFGCIWVALAVYSGDAIAGHRAERRRRAAATAAPSTGR
ncbi:EamA family transporter RarD [Azospirillum halopraeferens]|uniref:EamA family transporter RarD n=1 Tax=Azospirillum halopraeferens TaxID=34010 RepID=UPI000413E8DF|nr:EamA family transporter RarD [Azospirillum halopraeferens]